MLREKGSNRRAAALVVAGLMGLGACRGTPEASAVLAEPFAPTRTETELVWGGWHVVPIEPGLAELFLEAHDLDQRGRRRDAIFLLNDALEENPDSFSLHEARAALYAAIGFQRGAEHEFELVTELAPERGPAWAARGRMCQELGLATASVGHLERAAELGVDDAELHLAWARALRRLRSRGPAARHYHKALERLPEPATELLIEMASLYYEARQADSEALERACALLGLAPDALQASLVRALLEERNGRAGLGTRYLRATRVDRDALEDWTRAVLLAVDLAEPGSRP